MWVLQNLVQQSGDQHWAEQDLYSQWQHHIQGLYQPFNSICSVRYQTATLNISNQSFCWLQWAIQEASYVSLPPPVHRTDAATTASSAITGQGTPRTCLRSAKGAVPFTPFFPGVFWLHRCPKEQHLWKRYREVLSLRPDQPTGWAWSVFENRQKWMGRADIHTANVNTPEHYCYCKPLRALEFLSSSRTSRYHLKKHLYKSLY